MYQGYLSKLESLLSEKRLKHSIRVMEMCEILAKKYNFDENSAKIAGLLHDCARELPEQEVSDMLKNEGIQVSNIEKARPVLVHAKASSILARDEFYIKDLAILESIAVHTLARENMTLLDKIVYLADYVEMGRKFPGVEEIRKIAYNNIDDALIRALRGNIIHVAEKGQLIHPDTVGALNFLLLRSGV